MKKISLLFLFALTGCSSFPETNDSFKLNDYYKFCPKEESEKIAIGEKVIMYKGDTRYFYILPGDYIVSPYELSIMPQNKKNNSSDGMVKISSLQDLSDYFTQQGKDLKKIAQNISEFKIFPKEIDGDYPDKSLAKELVVEKYISVDNPRLVFCGLTLKSDFTPDNHHYSKYNVSKERDENAKGDSVYSGDKVKSIIHISPRTK